MKKALISVGALCSMATPAHAHWQYTRWGMTPEQVVASSSGAARMASASEMDAAIDGKKLAVGTFDSNGRKLNLEFWFAAQGLRSVTLMSKNVPDCTLLKRDMYDVYGSPLSEKTLGVSKNSVWQDRAKGNGVTFVEWIDHTCTIYYSALVSASDTGL